MPMTPKEMERLLLKNGFVVDRQKGSHRIFWNEKTKKAVTVPMHAKDLRKEQNSRYLKMQG